VRIEEGSRPRANPAVIYISAYGARAEGEAAMSRQKIDEAYGRDVAKTCGIAKESCRENYFE